MSYGKTKKQFDQAMKKFRMAVREVEVAVSSEDVPQDEVDEIIEDALAWSQKAGNLHDKMGGEVLALQRSWKRDAEEFNDVYDVVEPYDS